MRIARFVLDGDPQYGVVDDAGEILTAIHGDPFFQGVETGTQQYDLADVRLLAPIIPRSKLVGVGNTYRSAPGYSEAESTVRPLMFLKPNTAVTGPGDPVTLPEFAEEISYGVELCVVIGRICKDVPAERAAEVIFGYTCGNDLTATETQSAEGPWARVKGFDGAAPLGPWIETDLDTEDLSLIGRRNGVVVQDGSTSELVWSVAELVAMASEGMTLLPGDVIMTGSPGGIGAVQEGDRFEVEIEGIGTLRNTFVTA